MFNIQLNTVVKKEKLLLIEVSSYRNRQKRREAEENHG